MRASRGRSLILGAGHHLVPNSLPPTTDEARQRFVDYAIAAARSVSGPPPLFELWNEWNIATRNNPAFNAENYLALAAVTYPAVKRIAPNAPFVVGAIGDDPGWRWTESLLQGGVLKYADGISVHLYNHCDRPARRTAAEVIERLNAFHRLVSQASGRPDFPVYVTETGWPTPTAKCGVNAQAQADNTRSWSCGRRRHQAGSRGYGCTNSRTAEPIRPRSRTISVSIISTTPRSPRSARFATAGPSSRSSLKAEVMKVSNDVTAIKSVTAKGQRLAIWSNDPAKRYEIRLKGDAPKVSFEYPCDPSPKPAAGAWMTVSSTPLLVKADETSIPEFDVRPRDH